MIKGIIITFLLCCIVGLFAIGIEVSQTSQCFARAFTEENTAFPTTEDRESHRTLFCEKDRDTYATLDACRRAGASRAPGILSAMDFLKHYDLRLSDMKQSHNDFCPDFPIR
jgi:hypothetical protein